MHDRIVHAPISNPKTIIDIGCGPGSVSRELALQFPTSHVYGIDLSPLSDEWNAPGTPTNLSFIQGDAMHLLSAGESRPGG